MMLRGKLLIVFFIILIVPSTVIAQQFNYAAELNKVDSAGFYSITLSPEISAKIKTDFADIRIADNDKKWVPHILLPRKPVPAMDIFTAFAILENKITDSGKNLLVIENTIATGIYNLQLFLKNAAVSRIASLSGSDNMKDWFIIDDNIGISRSYETVKDEYLQEINFPLTKYRFLRIIIDNMHNDPMLVTRAGSYAAPSYKKFNGYLSNPVPTFSQKDSNGYSYIEVRQQQPFQFDKISLVVSGAKFYDRELQIRLPGIGKNNITAPGEIIADFKLLSALPPVVELPRIKTALFFILIKNGDNPPLKIDSIFTQQQTITMVAYLEQGKKYQLLFGDSLASFADYDLQTFKDSISAIQPLNYGPINNIRKTTSVKVRDRSNLWIWLSIILAGDRIEHVNVPLNARHQSTKKLTIGGIFAG